MAKTPGSGRKKGSPNKKTIELLDICVKHGLHPFEGMVLLAKAEADPDKKFDKLEKIAQYVHPKRKAMEISNGDENGFLVVIKDYSKK